MIEPIHIATIGGQTLRFFRTPNDDGRPDFPWHCVDDLHRCLGLDRTARKFFLRKLREWGGVQTVATQQGSVVIAPNYMAQGGINAMVVLGQVSASLRAQYDAEGAIALKELVAHLGFPRPALFVWMKEATNRHG